MRLMRREPAKLRPEVQIQQRAVNLLNPQKKGGIDTSNVAIEPTTRPKFPERHRLALESSNCHYNFAGLRLDRHEVERVGSQKLCAFVLNILDAQSIRTGQAH